MDEGHVAGGSMVTRDNWNRNVAAVIVAAGVLTANRLLAQDEGPANAKGQSVNKTGKGYTAAFVIDPATRKVYFEENADMVLPTASMAKMMTCLIAVERVSHNLLKLDKPVAISANASKMGGSQIYAKQGQTFPMQTLLAAAMIQSANDAATAIAEDIAGSTEAFVAMMNGRAKQMGLNHTTFYDPHGLPNGKDPERVDKMSARDLATLGIELMKYPLMRQYAKAATYPFQNGTFTAGFTNPNHLVNPTKRDYMPEATGIKTGYSVPAGFCITASAEKGGRQLVAVVMGATKRYGPQSSFGIAARLMNEAFAK
jgi:D-alanyl-D-alanine carboxypeptidase (penicillin-binding protein 5/6)